MDERHKVPLPSGSRQPPRPPKLTAVGLDDDNGKRRFTVSKSAKGEGKFIRESGGKGQYGHVVLRIEPAARGKGVTILSELAKGAIPDEFVQPIASGIREGLEYGIDGAPIVDVTVRILDGTWHQIDSSELAFKLAGIFAAKDAFKMAEPVIVDESS